MGLTRNFSEKDIVAQPLSKTWPVEDCFAIDDPVKSAYVMALRAQIPRKPSGYGLFAEKKQKQWAEKVNAIRELANHVIKTDNFLQDKKLKGLDKLIGAHAEALKKLDKSFWNDVDSVRVRNANGKMSEWTYSNRKQNNDLIGDFKVDDDYKWSGKVLIATVGKENFEIFADKNTPDEKLYEALSQKVQARFPKATEAQKKAKELSFSLYLNNRTGKYFLAKKGDKTKTPLAEFDTIKEARLHEENNKTELAEAWEAVSALSKVKESDLRDIGNNARAGKDRRKGDISAEDFGKEFGFRGVQFGNWVSQKGALSRQNLLNGAYDALADLADALGMGLKDISLNGSLGFAFGARGFEAYIQNKLKKNGTENAFLVRYRDSELWPDAKQADELEPYYDNLISAIKKYKGIGKA